MADKMFYTLEETAERLGKSVDEVREMAGSGELQQFRDRDKLMFKVEQVDGMSGDGTMADSMGLELSDTGTTFDLADSTGGGDMTLADSSDDSMGLGDSTSGTQADSMAGSGVDVFSPGEVDAASPMDQTQVTSPQVTDDEVQLDSVGSGSGLLDLTRESDETSLGAELDEIFPGGETAAGASGISESAVGSSGVFESGMGETGASGPSGLENLAGATGVGQAMAADAGTSPMMARSFAGSAEDEIDPAWSGFTTGAMLGVLLALIVGLIVVAGAVAGTTTGLTDFITGSSATYWGTVLVLLIVAFALAGVGLVIGKASAK
ncbi:MAG: helix-turn-helix domain-containing protein [Planctomycetota bacterium]